MAGVTDVTLHTAPPIVTVTSLVEVPNPLPERVMGVEGAVREEGEREERAGVMVVGTMSDGGATTPCTTFSSLMPGDVDVHLPVHMPG